MAIKFDTNPIHLTKLNDSHTESAPAHRLVVLIPAHADFSAAIGRIWELARAAHMHIQLLSLCKDATEESRLRRELAAVSSLLLQDDRTCAEVKIEVGTNWLDALKSNYEAGDMIVCFAEQRTGILRKPLNQILEANFNATVYVIPDIVPQKLNPNRLSQITTWLGFTAVIVGFGLLQAQIIQFSVGWLQNLLLFLSIIPEFWLIWGWDRQWK